MLPQASGESSKVKVKVRVNINGIFNVSSASMVEKLENTEEPMEVSYHSDGCRHAGRRSGGVRQGCV